MGQVSRDIGKFLAPPRQETCSDKLQEKINTFLEYKRKGESFNVEVRNKKGYRNPDFLRHAVRYQDIDEIGSCFSKDVFDLHGYDETDFYDAIQPGSADSLPREGRLNKKSSVDSHAALPSAANVGAGYALHMHNKNGVKLRRDRQ